MMNKNATIQVRIDTKTKNEAKNILDQLHISVSDAIGIFLKQVCLNKGLPFDVKIPNKETVKALRQAQNKAELSAFESTDALFKELDG